MSKPSFKQRAARLAVASGIAFVAIAPTAALAYPDPRPPNTPPSDPGAQVAGEHRDQVGDACRSPVATSPASRPSAPVRCWPVRSSCASPAARPSPDPTHQPKSRRTRPALPAAFSRPDPGTTLQVRVVACRERRHGRRRAGRGRSRPRPPSEPVAHLDADRAADLLLRADRQAGVRPDGRRDPLRADAARSCSLVALAVVLVDRAAGAVPSTPRRPRRRGLLGAEVPHDAARTGARAAVP